jgi:hypothetical protein
MIVILFEGGTTINCLTGPGEALSERLRFRHRSRPAGSTAPV